MAFSHGLPLPMALEPDVKSYWMSRSVHTVPWIANFPCRFPPRSKLKNPNWKCKAWDVPKKAQPLSGPTTTFRFLKTWKQLPSHIPRSITGIAILVLNPGWISRVTRFLHVSPQILITIWMTISSCALPWLGSPSSSQRLDRNPAADNPWCSGRPPLHLNLDHWIDPIIRHSSYWENNGLAMVWRFGLPQFREPGNTPWNIHGLWFWMVNPWFPQNHLEDHPNDGWAVNFHQAQSYPFLCGFLWGKCRNPRNLPVPPPHRHEHQDRSSEYSPGVQVTRCHEFSTKNCDGIGLLEANLSTYLDSNFPPIIPLCFERRLPALIIPLLFLQAWEISEHL